MRHRIRVAIGCGLMALFALALPLAVSAHEQRQVGNYVLTVGFLNEPSYQGQPNGLDLRVAKNAANKTPVSDLEKTLKAEVIAGGKTMPLTIGPVYDNGGKVPGAYKAPFVPTATGDYTFHITGTIDGQKIDQKFTSSPNTFSSVVPMADAEFPAKVPAVSQLTDDVQQAKDDASTARTFGIIGIIVGALGLITGSGAFALSRRSPVRPQTEQASSSGT